VIGSALECILGRLARQHATEPKRDLTQAKLANDSVPCIFSSLDRGNLYRFSGPLLLLGLSRVQLSPSSRQPSQFT
jgi:hypothetical protein